MADSTTTRKFPTVFVFFVFKLNLLLVWKSRGEALLHSSGLQHQQPFPQKKLASGAATGYWFKVAPSWKSSVKLIYRNATYGKVLSAAHLQPNCWRRDMYILIYNEIKLLTVFCKLSAKHLNVLRDVSSSAALIALTFDKLIAPFSKWRWALFIL